MAGFEGWGGCGGWGGAERGCGGRVAGSDTDGPLPSVRTRRACWVCGWGLAAPFRPALHGCGGRGVCLVRRPTEAATRGGDRPFAASSACSQQGESALRVRGVAIDHRAVILRMEGAPACREETKCAGGRRCRWRRRQVPEGSVGLCFRRRVRTENRSGKPLSVPRCGRHVVRLASALTFSQRPDDQPDSSSYEKQRPGLQDGLDAESEEDV